MHGVVTIPDVGFHVGYVQPGDGSVLDVDHIEVDAAFGDDGLVDPVRLAIGGVSYRVEVVGWAPVLLESTDGRRSRLARALARFHGDDGDVGVGWIELNAGPQLA